MPPKSVPSRVVGRLMNSFTSQVARRALRSVGLSRWSVPMLMGFVREANRQIQWGNSALWRKRVESAKDRFAEFQSWQKEISPVYRYRGGSSRVRPHLSQETVRDKLRDPTIPRGTGKGFKVGRWTIDGETALVGGLAFIVLASLGGPMLAKNVNYVDPLASQEQAMASGHQFDLKL